MKEIGGYFGLERFNGREYYPELIALNTGRHALEYLIRAKGIKKIYIPFYICDSIICLCKKIGCEYEQYHISGDFKPVFEKKLDDNEYLYVVNYYGQLDDKILLEYKEQYNHLILDNVQAFFHKPLEGIDSIYSCRKFFGVADGAYLSTNATLDVNIETDVSRERMKHLLGRFETTASEYYYYFKENDFSFREKPLMKMSELTHNILRGINYEIIKKRREDNFQHLHSKLRVNNKLNIRKCEGPYAYPYLCSNGLELRKRLAKKGIYIATLWPNVLECDNSIEKEYAMNVLPLPCDQRYDFNDMNYLVEELAFAMEECV